MDSMLPHPPSRVVKKKAPTLNRHNGRHWHGRDSILSLLRLKDLRRNGYIDPPSQPLIEERFQGLSQQRPPDAVATAYEGFIHPIFKRANWRGLSQEDYEAIIPALRLASSLLCEPYVLLFIDGLRNRSRTPINDPEAEAVLGGPVYTFQSSPPATNLRDTITVLINMQDFVRFQFGATSHNNQAYMTTTSLRNTFGMIAHSTRAGISIRPEYLQVLKGQINVTHFVKAEDFDVEAGRLRTMTAFVHALLHELCHAIYKATTPISMHGSEPFYRDDRMAELGWAFTQVVFGGGIYPLGRNPRHTACPYGSGVARWPEGISYGSGRMRASAARYGETYARRSIVKMQWLQKFFTRRFWDVDVAPYTSGQGFKFDWDIALRDVGPTSKDFLPHETQAVLPGHPVSGAPPLSTVTDLRAMGFKLKPRKEPDETSEDTDGDDAPPPWARQTRDLMAGMLGSLVGSAQDDDIP